jgi:translation initiation factor 3 subunit D
MLEEIEFIRINKLRLDVPEAEDLLVILLLGAVYFMLILFRESYGRLFAYDKSYDRVTTKTQQPLQLVDRIKYNTTASDDPVLQSVSLSLFVLYLHT